MSFLFGSEYIVSYAISNRSRWLLFVALYLHGIRSLTHTATGPRLPPATNLRQLRVYIHMKLMTEFPYCLPTNFSINCLHGTKLERYKRWNKSSDFTVPVWWQLGDGARGGCSWEIYLASWVEILHPLVGLEFKEPLNTFNLVEAEGLLWHRTGQEGHNTVAINLAILPTAGIPINRLVKFYCRVSRQSEFIH